MDLHKLIKKHGESEVAAVLGVTVASLRIKRSGQRPLSVDDLFLLARRYGFTFDIEATVMRIGGKRHERTRVRPE